MLIPFGVMCNVCECTCVYGEGENEVGCYTAFRRAIDPTALRRPSPTQRLEPFLW